MKINAELSMRSKADLQISQTLPTIGGVHDRTKTQEIMNVWHLHLLNSKTVKFKKIAHFKYLYFFGGDKTTG